LHEDEAKQQEAKVAREYAEAELLRLKTEEEKWADWIERFKSSAGTQTPSSKKGVSPDFKATRNSTLVVPTKEQVV